MVEIRQLMNWLRSIGYSICAPSIPKENWQMASLQANGILLRSRETPAP
jgi:hypothetical protein